MVLALAVGLPSAVASATEALQTRNDIVDLMLCYGKGTDTFGEPGNPDGLF